MSKMAHDIIIIIAVFYLVYILLCISFYFILFYAFRTIFFSLVLSCLITTISGVDINNWSPVFIQANIIWKTTLLEKPVTVHSVSTPSEIQRLVRISTSSTTCMKSLEKRFEDTKEAKSQAVNRRTDNTMAKKKRTKEQSRTKHYTDNTNLTKNRCELKRPIRVTFPAPLVD